MSIWVIMSLIVAGGIILLLVVASLPQRKPYNLTKEEVANEIEAFLNGTGGAHDWSDFCTFTIADPELDRIRARCAQLDKEYPPNTSSGYCNEEGHKVLRGYVEYLRSTNV